MKPFVTTVLLLALPSAWAGEWEGTVQWSQKVALGPAVSGIVERVEVEPGATVKKGERLLALDPTPFQAQVAAARAALARARIAREEAARDLKQAEELYARTVLSTVELDNAKMKRGRADAGVQEAAAQLERAEYSLRSSVVRAPFDGIVAARNAQPGQVVVANLEPPALVTLVRRGEYVVVVPLPAKTATGLQPGRPASVQVGARKFEGKVQSVALEPVAGAGETRYEVRVAFSAGDVFLRAGQPASIELP